ncbi:MAG: cytochrome b/b6 domain-containing protein [Gammaproteobacteria bacterium]|nr:cytochrome b/b6 domain-containing protein [Gammaproteobacteria bacterium]
MTSDSSDWDRPTRFLHMGLALTVTIQLLVSLWMVPPGSRHPSTPLTHAGFIAHEWIGLCALAIVLAHWVWSLLSSGAAGVGHLFPVSRDGRREVVAELRELLSGRMAGGGPRGGLAGLVHGLGLLAVTGIAVTGGVLFVMLSAQDKSGAFTRSVGHLHSLISTFVWIYWYGHIGMALLHQLKGDGMVRRMFRLG